VQAQIDALATRYEGTHADTSGTWSLQTGGVALQAGALDDLAPALGAMMTSSHIGANWKAAYALALLSSGDRDGAAGILDDFREPTLDYLWLTTMQTIAEVAVGLGRADRAEPLFAALAPYRDQLGITGSGSLCFGLVATTLGALALVRGDTAAAVESLELAVALADAMDAPWERTRSRRLLARALLDAPDVPDRSARVVELVGTAAELAERHGLRAEAQALAELRELAPFSR
jgi:hypothetical protein